MSDSDMYLAVAAGCQAKQDYYGVPFTPEVGKWYPLDNPPTTDVKFLVGVWDGEQLWNADYTKFVWAGKPVWRQALSHNENPHGPNGNTRGWNHRNGPLLIRATHWSPCPEPPELTEPVVPVEDTRLTKV